MKASFCCASAGNSCCVSSWSFYDKLLFVTLAPIIVLAFGLAGLRVVRGSPARSQHGRSSTKRPSRAEVVMDAVGAQLGLTTAVSKALLWCEAI